MISDSPPFYWPTVNQYHPSARPINSLLKCSPVFTFAFYSLFSTESECIYGNVGGFPLIMGSRHTLLAGLHNPTSSILFLPLRDKFSTELSLVFLALTILTLHDTPKKYQGHDYILFFLSLEIRYSCSIHPWNFFFVWVLECHLFYFPLISLGTLLKFLLIS